jgi:hypothetical protein
VAGNCDYRRVQVFLWRRVLADLAVVSLAPLGWAVASRLASSAVPSGASSGSCGLGLPECVAPSPHARVYVAKPGDTIWAIAVRYSGGRDPRPLEYELEAQLGGGALQPGEALRVP